ncbi:class D sortase [Salisediminibacterium selenitireducens]|uniref:Sortase family protein n=1 Tax=Bacillus selenitireducens (strain ATCC 700615 / DSM 15326 / MLS10) TaxID=439292 RepID=D6XY70_BACIE|nr:class D sortase [Salisediminibacterium selenitireducens]ADH98143.1 sortase family protein [[Bacillus] selenitireducens MLS10]
MKKELKIQFLSSFLILTGIGFIAYFYMSHQTAMGGVYAINEHPERALSDPVNIEMEDMEKGDEVALLRIPALNKEYLTYWGTEDDALDRGVGMHESQWTTTPDEMGHTLLSGHRDTVFRELGDLEIGDEMIVLFDGITYTYTIDDIWITSADDQSVVVEKEEATLTLSTCYPFHLLGAAPDRYIIQASLSHHESFED